MSQTQSIGSRSYGGKRKHGLAWLPWAALLAILLLAALIYFVVAHVNDSTTTDASSRQASSTNSATTASAIGAGSGGLVGGGNVTSQPSSTANGASTDAKTAGTVLFADNSASVDGNGTQVVANAVALIRQQQTTNVTVTGFTDTAGNDPSNGSLSQQRADAVATALRSQLGNSVQVTTAARGEQNPVASNTTSNGADNPQGRQLDRRVTISFG